MLAGIILQLCNYSRVHDFQLHHLSPCIVIIVAYAVLASEFFIRHAYDRPFTSRESVDNLQKSRPGMSLRLKMMSYALGFSTVCLFIRYVKEVFCSSIPFYWLSAVVFIVSLSLLMGGTEELYLPRFTSVCHYSSGFFRIVNDTSLL
jgi:cytochrome c biogenesis protein CcdA